MEKSTTQLLEKLAEKLGVTTEYLWGVLLQQAPVQAYTNIFVLVVMTLPVYWLYRKYKAVLNSDGYTYDDETPWAVGILLAVVTYIVLFACLISSTISGLFNPEYWALNRILEAIG